MPIPIPDADIAALDKLYTPDPVVRTTEEMGIPGYFNLPEFHFAKYNGDSYGGGSGGSRSDDDGSFFDGKSASAHLGLVNANSPFGSMFEYALGFGTDDLRIRVFYSGKDLVHDSKYTLMDGGSGNSSLSTEIVRETTQPKSFSHYGLDVAKDITKSIVGVAGIGIKRTTGDPGTFTESITHYRDGEPIGGTSEDTPIHAFDRSEVFLRLGGGPNVDLGDLVELEILGIAHVDGDLDTYFVVQAGGVVNF